MKSALSKLLKTLAVFLLRISYKFNKASNFLLIDTEDIRYSDPEYITTVLVLSEVGTLQEILYKRIEDDGHDEMIEVYDNFMDELEGKMVGETKNKLVKASEVYSGGKR